jgi:membrane-bound lytic murein transglycosylase D
MNYLDEHNFYDIGEEMPMPHDTINTSKFLHFNTLASLTGICLEDLQKLNPSVQRNALPQTSKSFTLKIPMMAKEILAQNRAAILDSASKTGKNELELLARNTAGSTYGKDRIVYRIKSGDVLGSIAMRYKVRVSDIQKWNNLSGNTIRVGQSLNIWLKQPTGGVHGEYRSAPKGHSYLHPFPTLRLMSFSRVIPCGIFLKNLRGLQLRKLNSSIISPPVRFSPGRN